MMNSDGALPAPRLIPGGQMFRIFRANLTAFVAALAVGSVEPVALAQEQRIVRGQVLDTRVGFCGLRVSGTERMQIEPVIDAHDDLEGTVELDVTRVSVSGQNRSRQTSGFSRAHPARLVVQVEQPADLDLVLLVTDMSGKLVCEVRQSLSINHLLFKI